MFPIALRMTANATQIQIPARQPVCVMFQPYCVCDGVSLTDSNQQGPVASYHEYLSIVERLLTIEEVPSLRASEWRNRR